MVQPQAKVVKNKKNWKITPSGSRTWDIHLRYVYVAGGTCAWHPWTRIARSQLVPAKRKNPRKVDYGLGLFAAREFKEGERIGFYSGTVVDGAAFTMYCAQNASENERKEWREMKKRIARMGLGLGETLQLVEDHENRDKRCREATIVWTKKNRFGVVEEVLYDGRRTANDMVQYIQDRTGRMSNYVLEYDTSGGRTYEFVDGSCGNTGWIQFANDPRGTTQRANAVITETGMLIATRRIAPGKEILWSYGKNYWMDPDHSPQPRRVKVVPCMDDHSDIYIPAFPLQLKKVNERGHLKPVK